GNWSLTNTFPFIKGEAIGNIVTGEYFVDTDPGFGHALPINFTASSNISNYTFSANVSSATTTGRAFL
ncbi:hypothetical protein, partial [Flavobacterium sp.]|uniref:hypothetical protein n=1 Tax=Flavobacterium sp. TaxID=239 RepID=UPI00374CBB07